MASVGRLAGRLNANRWLSVIDGINGDDRGFKMRIVVVLLAVVSVAASIGGGAWRMPAAPAGGPVLPAAGTDSAARIAALRAHLARNTDDGAAWKALGQALMAARDFEPATDAYAEAARVLPRDGEVNAALRRLAEIAAEARR